MNKMHGVMAKKLSRCTKGSRRWKKLRKARATQASRIERRVRDVRHKATRQVIDFCMAHEVGKVFIGNPDGVRRNRTISSESTSSLADWEYHALKVSQGRKRAMLSISPASVCASMTGPMGL